MTNISTAPQSVIDDQDRAAATEPITITIGGDFGTVSWSPGEHDQDHLRALAEEGRLDGYLEFAEGKLGEAASTLGLTLCADRDPTIMLLASMMSLLESYDEESEPPML